MLDLETSVVETLVDEWRGLRFNSLNDVGVGDLIGEIIAPGVANFMFGGPGNNVLYMMADIVIWAAEIKAVGATRRQSV